MALDGAGISRWDPKTMLAGAPLPEQLRAAINRCEMCVFLATQHSIQSEWCSAELGAFWGAGKTVVLFMADPDLDATGLPPQFRDALRANTPDALMKAIPESLRVERADGICTAIASRHDLYIECTKLIQSSQVVRDTTWGRRATKLKGPESDARNEYRKAIEQFCSEGKQYYELLTAQKRAEYVEDAVQFQNKYDAFKSRILPVDISKLSMLDMMIGDETQVIFSHVSAEEAQPVQYVLARSVTLARLFRQFYSEAWRDSVDIVTYLKDNPIGYKPLGD